VHFGVAAVKTAEDNAGRAMTKPTSEHSGEHLENIRRRFTDTAAAFSDFVLARKADEAEHVAAAIAQSLEGAAACAALDLACGPGTFLRSLGRHVGWAVGVDITPAMLARARQEASRAGLSDVSLVCGDANALPFADASWDVALCAYALHHLLRPEQVVREMARVVRRGGRVAIVDMVLPAGADAAAHDQIERVRDPSHSHTLSAADLRRLFGESGLRELAAESHHRQREFDDWMHVAGREPDSAPYAEARALMEVSLRHDSCGFAPRLESQTGILYFTQQTLFLLAKKE
jgi:ubiquinone/menaquinone biosynthesis C-methylase UbiE